MPFDPRVAEAKMSLAQIHPEDLPNLAIEALKAGFDGPAVLRLASLLKPSGWETDPLLPAFLNETGMRSLSPLEASERVAYDLAIEALQSRNDPLSYAERFYSLWVDVGYPAELSELGLLPQNIYLALEYSGEPGEKVRADIHDQLQTYVRGYEATHAVP